MLRITVVAQKPDEVALKIEGRVCGDNVRLLDQETARWLRQTDRLVLDLSGVQFIDDAGLGVLRRWPRTKITLRGGSMFISSLLHSQGIESFTTEEGGVR